MVSVKNERKKFCMTGEKELFRERLRKYLAVLKRMSAPLWCKWIFVLRFRKDHLGWTQQSFMWRLLWPTLKKKSRVSPGKLANASNTFFTDCFKVFHHMNQVKNWTIFQQMVTCSQCAVVEWERDLGSGLEVLPEKKNLTKVIVFLCEMLEKAALICVHLYLYCCISQKNEIKGYSM